MKNNVFLKAFTKLPLWAKFALPAIVVVFLLITLSSITKFIKLFFLVGSVALIGYGLTRFYQYVKSSDT